MTGVCRGFTDGLSFFFFLFKCFTAPQHQNKALGLQRGAMWGRREAEKQQLVQ